MTFRKLAIFSAIVALIACASPGFAGKGDVKADYRGYKQCGKKFSGSFEHGLSNKCYSCPSGYSMAIWSLVLKKPSCLKGFTKKKTATYKGREGCAGSSKEYLPNGKCYSCPAGYKRNASPANPGKSAVCKIDKKKLRSKFKAAKANSKSDIVFLQKKIKQDRKIPSTRTLSRRFNADAHRPEAPSVTQYSGDRKRIDFMYDVVNSFESHNDDYDKNYQTVTYVKTAGGALIGGYAQEWGFSMTKTGNDTYECRKVRSDAYSLGLQVDIDIAEGVGMHQFPIDSVAGHSNGYTSAAAWFDTTLSWTTDGDPAISVYWPSLIFQDGSMTADGGVITSLGISAAYAHSYSKQDSNPIPCEVLVWGPDFDKVESSSWVKYTE